jgi:hypothetical protein
MVAEHIVCPGCRTLLAKPIQLQILGESHKAGGSYVAMGSSDTMPCSVCGHRMSIPDIIAGKHDPGGGVLGTIMSFVVLFGIVAVMVYACSR